nr:MULTISPECIES: monovalent cation/H+ antiporter complex subunit F [unclassified Frankia]
MILTAVYTATFVLLSIAGLLTLARLLVGPTDLDRIVALDVLVILIAAGVTVEIGMRREGWNIALVAVVSLLGFLGSVTAARLVERQGEIR